MPGIFVGLLRCKEVGLEFLDRWLPTVLLRYPSTVSKVKLTGVHGRFLSLLRYVPAGAGAAEGVGA